MVKKLSWAFIDTTYINYVDDINVSEATYFYIDCRSFLSSGAMTLAPETDLFDTPNLTFSKFTGVPEDSGAYFYLIITCGGSVDSITWPSNIIWEGGSAPSLTSSTTGGDVLFFLTYDGGSNWIGSKLIANAYR